MERQVAFALVALCTLLGCACSQCEFEEPADKSVQPLLLASPLDRVRESDPDSCRAQCCARAGCDAAVLGLPADGLPQCFLIGCGGACTLLEDSSSQFKVFLRKSGGRASDNAPQVVPLMLDVSTRTEDNKNSTVTKEVCVLSSEVGLCKAAFPRFFYNASDQTCSTFIYGGCGGNGNNFETKEECETLCSGVTRSNQEENPPPNKSARMAPPLNKELSEDIQDQTRELTAEDYAERCGSKPDVGPCRAAFPRWFYDGTSGHCQTFIYGGCKGNKNNYEREDECNSACSEVKILPSKKKSPEHELKEFREWCAAPPDSGPCRAAFTMFYYDPKSNGCQSFIYGGCKGNNNRYVSEEECTNHCGAGATSVEGHGKGRGHWTAAFFLFLALAAVSLLLLTTLVIITVRRHHLSHRSRASDKEELLTDENSSLDSLPLPDSPTKA